ncbi:MAG: hypothetical protein RJA70_468 [Pseudomonadota bacterium]|jgi:DNA-binding LacI/PurR family transcriptional regulator
MSLALYAQLKALMIARIIDGTYVEGTTIPSEDQLGRTHGVSRVTVRKALDELKVEGVLSSVRGQGTRVTYQNRGVMNPMDIIALVAFSPDTFFAEFYRNFEHTAEANNSLVVLKQGFEQGGVAPQVMLSRLIEKDIRNIVIWPRLVAVSPELLTRVRAVGVNLVIFDHPEATPCADVVCLDHALAIQTLCRHLRAQTTGTIDLLTYTELPLSLQVREATFLRETGGSGQVHRVARGEDMLEQILAELSRLKRAKRLPGGLIASCGELGLLAARAVRELNLDVALCSVDWFEGMEQYPLTAYEQPVKRMAEEAYLRLKAQAESGDRWRARRSLHPGQLRASRPK